MQKTIAIVGITGHQGGGVANVMLAAGWKVKGITRDAASSKAEAWSNRGVEIASADFSDEASLQSAFMDAHAIFAMTNFWAPVFTGASLEEAASVEEETAMKLARAAAATEGLEHYIYASLPSASRLSGGEFPLPHFDGKARADERIRQTMPNLASRMTTLFFGFYPSNFTVSTFKPVEAAGLFNKHVLILPTSPDVGLEVTGDMAVTPGLWVRQILRNPNLSLGKYTGVGTEYISFRDMLKAWNEVTGKSAVLISCSAAEYEELWGALGNELVIQFAFNKKFPDWRIGVEDRWVSKEELGITAEEAKGFKYALEQIKDQL